MNLRVKQAQKKVTEINFQTENLIPTRFRNKEIDYVICKAEKCLLDWRKQFC